MTFPKEWKNDEAGGTPITAAELIALEERVGDRAGSIVSALPGSPDVGDVCIFEASSTVYWQLVYDGVGALPWKKIGGPPLFDRVETSETTGSAVYTNLATVGPSLTVPLAGEYEVSLGIEMWNSLANNNTSMSYAIGATAADAADSILLLQPASITVIVPSWGVKVKEFVKGAALVAKYRVSPGGTGTFRKRTIVIDPVRVG